MKKFRLAAIAAGMVVALSSMSAAAECRGVSNFGLNLFDCSGGSCAVTAGDCTSQSCDIQSILSRCSDNSCLTAVAGNRGCNTAAVTADSGSCVTGNIQNVLSDYMQKNSGCADNSCTDSKVCSADDLRNILGGCTPVVITDNSSESGCTDGKCANDSEDSSCKDTDCTDGRQDVCTGAECDENESCTSDCDIAESCTSDCDAEDVCTSDCDDNTDCANGDCGSKKTDIGSILESLGFGSGTVTVRDGSYNDFKELLNGLRNGGTQVITPDSSTQDDTQQSDENKQENVQAEEPKEETVEESGYEVSEYEQKVVELVNEERAKYGLSPLTLNTELSRVARIKSQDMKDKGYFSHTSPTYGSPFDMMKQFGISYRTAGENIAMGQRTPEEVVNAWMNSEGHRANILNSSYTQIGVGYVQSGNYWTQMFIG